MELPLWWSSYVCYVVAVDVAIIGVGCLFLFDTTLCSVGSGIYSREFLSLTERFMETIRT